jgi:hypothetical protein
MATPPLSDQERALLAQFVATHATNAGDAPILIQYALDRLAKQPGSTLAEVVSALSPNGFDASVDYGPYLDVVNRALGPSAPAMGQGGSSGRESNSNPSTWGGPAPVGVMKPGASVTDLVAMLTGQQPAAKVAPSRVHVASLDPLPQATPAPSIAPIRQPAPAPTVQPAPASPVPVFEPPAAPAPARLPPIAPARNPIDDVRLPPATPQYVSPPRGVAISPTGPFRENVPGPSGTTVPNKDQSRLAPSVGLPVADGAAPATRSVQSVPVPAPDLITRSFNSLPAVQGPFSTPNSGEDLALNPVRGVNAPEPNARTAADGRILIDTPQFATNVTPTLPAPTPTVDDRSLAAKGYGDLTQLLNGMPQPVAPVDPRLSGPIKTGGKQIVAPTPATPSQAIREQRMPPTGNVQLSDADRELLTRAVATEVDPRVAQRNPDAYELQAERVLDTMLNRLASDQFPQTAAEMLNQRNQFSAINGPVARPGAENIPASRVDPALRDILTSYLDDRTSGLAPSSVGGAVNYANPVASDASNLGWVNGLNLAVDDAGPFSHRYGVADGMHPAEAVFGNPRLDPKNFLSGGVMEAFAKPQMSRLTNSSKPVQVKAAPPPATDLMSPFLAPVDKTARNSPTTLRPTSEKQSTAREPISNAFTQPAARPVVAPTRVASVPATKISSPVAAAPRSSAEGGGFGGGSSPSFTGSNTGSSGSRAATVSTSSSAKTATVGGGKVSSPTVSAPSSSKPSSQKNTSSPSTSSGKTSNSGSSGGKTSSAKNR